jgi:hypothetical protein
MLAGGGSSTASFVRRSFRNSTASSGGCGTPFAAASGYGGGGGSLSVSPYTVMMHLREPLRDADQQQIEDLIQFLRQLKFDATFGLQLARGDDDGEASPLDRRTGGVALFSCVCDPDLPALLLRSIAVIWEACVLRISSLSARRTLSKRKA